MRTPLAWRNITHGRVRSLVALCGTAFAILLLFMQLGFHAAAANSATALFEALDFDVMVLSPEYSFAALPAGFSRAQLERVRAAANVESVKSVWVELGEWRNVETRLRWNVLTVGVEPEQAPFRSPAVNALLPRLTSRDNALADLVVRPEPGRMAVGTVSEVQHHRVRIVGEYRMGGGFAAGATMVTSRDTFRELFPDSDPSARISLGLVKLAPGTDPRAAAAEINRRLQPAAVARTRAEISGAERSFWLNVKPIGIMFTSGVLLAFVAGAVILYQTLASEVQNRLREYATLKALGYGEGRVYGVIVSESLIFATLGFVPAFCLASVLYFLLRTRALVPVTMDLPRAAGVFLLTMLMCLSAAFFASRKLRAADPADLF